MVKGLSRRTVLVRFPETGLFEEALFVVREDRGTAGGVSADQIISEACQIAQKHAPYSHKKHRRTTWPPVAYTAVGAFSVGLAWLLTIIFA